MEKYIACICEGAAECAILDLLLDNHMLIFEREDLLEETLLRCRSGKEFQERYLRKGFDERIIVYRILDSRRENFNISKAYKHKVEIKQVITAPEIEMLIICSEDKYSEYSNEKRKNHDLKPSAYCKSALRYKNVKNYDFVLQYFSDINILKKALNEYKRISKIPKNEMCIFDLLK
ncbi:MAG: hypothetical protein NC223_08210 [Butyrivibrio sp.]|nr:hypothetical protein [Butyrivibrio sp.]